MTVDTEQQSADLLSTGWDSLARGAWDDAHAAFVAAVAQDASAEALEGLGMAAWWTNAVDEAFRTRDAAYRCYVERGDQRAAARVAIMLSMDHFTRRGEHAISNGWVRRAYRLLDGLDPGPEHALVAAWDGHIALLVEHDPARARRLGAEAAALARALGILDLEMLALALEGYARVCAGEVAKGMRLLDEATAAVVGGDMTDLDAMTLACCYLIYACERVRDVGRAAQWCDHLRQLALRWSYHAMFSFCRTHYAGLLMARGSWEQADAELTAAMAELASTHPALAAEAIVRLAELRRRQGRFDEAGTLLRRLDEYPHRAFGGTLALLGRAALALDLGDPRNADALAERYLRAVQRDNRMDRVPGLEVLVRARVALGDHAGAARTLGELEATAADVATPALLAAASFSAGVVAVAIGDYEAARRCFEDAVDLFEQSGAPDEIARARLELAGALAGLGREVAAEAEVGAALATFQRLGAEREAERAADLLRHMQRQRDSAAPRAGDRALTPREREVLRLVARGMSDKEIAAALILSSHTIHRHIANILTKLDVPSRSAAVAYAAQHDLL